MTDKLLPCPFCGESYPEIRSEGKEWFVACTDAEDCGAEGHRALLDGYAVECWNRREGIPPSSRMSVGDGWKAVPAEATQDLLNDAKGEERQVLCYEKGRYYNAWLEFDEYEGGWLWMDEGDSEPNPSHYRILPEGPAATEADHG